MPKFIRSLFFIGFFLTSQIQAGVLNKNEKAAKLPMPQNPLLADEEIDFVPVDQLGAGGFGLHDSFLGLLQKNHRNQHLKVFELYLFSQVEVPISKADCEAAAQKLLFISPKRGLQIAQIDPMVVNKGRACDVKLLDPNPRFHERHLFIFTARKHTYAVAALFPQGSTPLEISELKKFIRSLH